MATDTHTLLPHHSWLEMLDGEFEQYTVFAQAFGSHRAWEMWEPRLMSLAMMTTLDMLSDWNGHEDKAPAHTIARGR